MTSSKTSPSDLSPVFPIRSKKRFSILLGLPISRLNKLAKHFSSSYHPFPKKTGSKSRTIDNPNDFMKEVQKRIKDRLLLQVSLPEYVIGGIKGKKPIEHPQRHVGKKVVVTVDIKDCFPSITNAQIYTVWRDFLGCTPPVAKLATKLTSFDGHLPLGAPTSTYLCNLVLLPCVKRLVEIAKAHGLSRDTSQYIDDLAFSGESLSDNFITTVIEEFRKYGLKIKREKIRVMRAGTTQEVTKKIVNAKVSFSHTKRNNLRTALYQLSRMKMEDENYKKSYASVKGRINSIKSLHPTLASKMIKSFNGLPKPN